MESFSTPSVNLGLLKAEDAKTICLTEEELGNSCVFV